MAEKNPAGPNRAHVSRLLLEIHLQCTLQVVPSMACWRVVSLDACKEQMVQRKLTDGRFPNMRVRENALYYIWTKVLLLFRFSWWPVANPQCCAWMMIHNRRTTTSSPRRPLNKNNNNKNNEKPFYRTKTWRKYLKSCHHFLSQDVEDMWCRMWRDCWTQPSALSKCKMSSWAILNRTISNVFLDSRSKLFMLLIIIIIIWQNRDLSVDQTFFKYQFLFPLSLSPFSVILLYHLLYINA